MKLSLIHSFLKTLLSYFLIGTVLAFFLPVLFVWAALPEKFRFTNKFIFSYVSLFNYLLLKATLVNVNFVGNIKKFKGQFLFVSNHQSALDIILLGCVAGANSHIWFAKEELKKNLFIGFWLNRMSVFVSFDSSYRSSRYLIKGINLMKKYKLSALIFPEGGRYRDGKIHDFFAGFAVIAKRIGCPVVPIKIDGANKVYPTGSFLIKNVPVTVKVGEIIECGEDETTQDFTKRVRDWFLKN